VQTRKTLEMSVNDDMSMRRASCVKVIPLYRCFETPLLLPFVELGHSVVERNGCGLLTPTVNAFSERMNCEAWLPGL
jgi:hypothetical protein